MGTAPWMKCPYFQSHKDLKIFIEGNNNAQVVMIKEGDWAKYIEEFGFVWFSYGKPNTHPDEILFVSFKF